ncbi:putative hydroxymethylpyrimidine transporter CytX [Jeongeupia wiesaeckerbachi]|uniref:putative hydroxymethylpyrimidine transporter CytX n=1 Tax=Jeongeupia wiesaeckerbachi TaxID=3051218 RepID=UPI003D8018D7
MKPTGTYDPRVPVPLERRVFSARDVMSLWFSLAIGLMVLQTGALLVPGLGFGAALTAIVIGSVVGVACLASVAVIGADTGLATMSALRPTLGLRGASLPAICNLIQLIGWGAFEIVVMRDAAGALIQRAGAESALWQNPVLWTLLFGGLSTLIAVFGPLGFVRRVLRRWGIWMLLAAAAWLTWHLFAAYDVAELFSRPGTGALGLGTGIDLVIAMPLSWLPLIADYTRFSRSASASFRGTLAGYLVGNLWFCSLGAAYTLAFAQQGGDNALLFALAASGGGLALLLILLDESEKAFADIHSAAVSACTLVPAKVEHAALAFGVLCTAIALFVPFARFESFLLLIGSLFAPLFGVVLVDHFVIRRRQIAIAAIAQRDGPYWYNGGWHVRALLAWSLGIATYHLTVHLLPGMMASVPALLIGGAGYWLLSLTATRTAGSAA